MNNVFLLIVFISATFLSRGALVRSNTSHQFIFFSVAMVTLTYFVTRQGAKGEEGVKGEKGDTGEAGLPGRPGVPGKPGLVVGPVSTDTHVSSLKTCSD